MLINRHIGFDEVDGMGIDGSLFQESLLQLDQMGKKRIQVWINSTGGIVMDGYNICNAILKSKTPVDTYCMGMAASIAGVIFQTGRKRIMADYGILMYHNPYSEGASNDNPMLESMRESLNTLIRSKCGMSAEDVQAMMDRTSFITSSEAYEMKLCDQVENTVSLNTKYAPKNAAKFWLDANRVINRLINTSIKTESKMLKVCNKLGLNPEASEDAILSKIEEMENKAAAAEVENKSKVDKIKEEMEAKEKELAELKEKYKDAKAKADEAEAKEAEAKNKLDEENAKNLVETAVKEGKIANKAEVIDTWKAKAKADFDGTKALLEGIAVNKTAAKFTIATKEGEAAEKYPSVATDMAKISNKLEKQ